MAETFQRCTNGHIIPKGATFCPWCGEAVSQEQAAPVSDAATIGSQPTAIIDPADAEGAGRPTVQFEGNPAEPDRTLVQYAAGNPQGGTGRGRLVGWLVSYDIDANGAAFALFEGRQTIGRDRSCDIWIEDPQLSQQHAIILYRNGRFIFEDQLSTNGSIVNGKETIGQIEIIHGDFLEMGRNTFVFVTIPRWDKI